MKKKIQNMLVVKFSNNFGFQSYFLNIKKTKKNNTGIKIVLNCQNLFLAY
jgi:hypothetical protein